MLSSVNKLIEMLKQDFDNSPNKIDPTYLILIEVY